MARIIAVSNQKGGVGKTTTTVNTAACLADAGFRVLLIDLDPQGNASSGLGIDKNRVSKSMYDVLTNAASLEEVLLPTAIETLLVAPSNTDLVGAEIELTAAMSRETRLSDAIETVQDAFDYVLLDCPPSLGLLTLNALTAAGSVLVPLQSEYYALEGLGELFQTITLVRKRLNPSLRIEGILMTLYDSRNKLNQQVHADVRKHFGDDVFENFIPRNIKLGEAPSFGQPIIHYAPTAKGARAYVKLTRELLERHGVTDVEMAHDRRTA